MDPKLQPTSRSQLVKLGPGVYLVYDQDNDKAIIAFQNKNKNTRIIELGDFNEANNVLVRAGVISIVESNQPAIRFLGTNITPSVVEDVAGQESEVTYTLPQSVDPAASPTFKNLSVTDNLILSATKGEGVKLDPAAPTFGWEDLIGQVEVKVTGATAPAYNVFRGNIRGFQFSNVNTNEVASIYYHIPHDYLPGSAMYIHAHWTQIAVDTGGPAGVPGTVKWQFEVSYAKGHQQAAYSAPFTTFVTQQASGTQYQHMIAEVQLSATTPSGTQLDSDDIETDGVIKVRAFRDPTDPADTLDQMPFLDFVDIHYQSTGRGTKNKAPAFDV